MGMSNIYVCMYGLEIKIFGPSATLKLRHLINHIDKEIHDIVYAHTHTHRQIVKYILYQRSTHSSRTHSSLFVNFQQQRCCDGSRLLINNTKRFVCQNSQFTTFHSLSISPSLMHLVKVNEQKTLPEQMKYNVTMLQMCTWAFSSSSSSSPVQFSLYK